MPSTAATGGGIAGGTTPTTMLAPATALALASTLTAVATMAIACRPFNQEVEDCGAEPCVTTTTGGGIIDGTTSTTTTAPALASASASALTAAATMVNARRPFAQEVEDSGAELCVTLTSCVLRDDYK